MKEDASQLISKLCQLYLKVKKNEEVEISTIYKLNNIIEKFKIDKRKYRDLKDEDQIEELTREFEGLKSKNKEVLLYMSVLGNMIAASDKCVIKRMEKKSDQDLAKVLLEYKNREDLSMLKDQEINNGKVNYFFFILESDRRGN